MPTTDASWLSVVVPRVDRSPKADLDERDIWLTIATDNIAAADRFIADLYDAEERLAAFSQLGQARPRFGENLRTWVLGSYLIVYRVTSSAVEIIRIVHGARDIDDLLAES